MQPLSTHKKISLSLVVMLLLSITTSSLHAAAVPAAPTTAAATAIKATPWTLEKTAALSAITLAIASFLWLKLKKTQPKCVYPQWEENDTIINILKNAAKSIWFTFDEICAGQSAKGERVQKIHFNPENPYEAVYEYGKIDPRGVAGNLEAIIKPAIIPAFTLMVLFNKEFKTKLVEAFQHIFEFINNPRAPFNEVWEELKKIPATK